MPTPARTNAIGLLLSQFQYRNSILIEYPRTLRLRTKEIGVKIVLTSVVVIIPYKSYLKYLLLLSHVFENFAKLTNVLA